MNRALEILYSLCKKHTMTCLPHLGRATSTPHHPSSAPWISYVKANVVSKMSIMPGGLCVAGSGKTGSYWRKDGGEVLEEKLPRVQSSSPLRGILQNISNLL